MDELISSSIVKEKVNSSSISEFASFKLNSKFQIKQSLTRCHWLRARWARPPLKGNYVAKELLQLKIGPGVNCQLVGRAWCLFKRLHSVLWIGITQLERIVLTRYEPCSVCCEFWTLSCSQSVVCISICASAQWAVHFWLCTLCAVASLEEFHMTACHQPQIAFSLTCHKLNCLQPPKKKISLAVSFKESTSGPNMLPVCDPLVISRPVDTWVVLSQISCPQKHLEKMIFWPSKQIIANSIFK